MRRPAMNSDRIWIHVDLLNEPSRWIEYIPNRKYSEQNTYTTHDWPNFFVFTAVWYGLCYQPFKAQPLKLLHFVIQV